MMGITSRSFVVIQNTSGTAPTSTSSSVRIASPSDATEMMPMRKTNATAATRMTPESNPM